MQRFSIRRSCLAAVALAMAPQAAVGQEWVAPAASSITLPARGDAPLIACTAAELERLRAAYRGGGPARAPIAEVVDRAAKALAAAVEFPPRGGQHNQWYQCEDCQIGLQTREPTRHQCPSCKKIYTGAPYDDVVYSRVHGANLAQARDCAWAFAITGEDRFLERTRRILLGYAERYRSYPYHDNRLGNRSRSGGHLKAQTLSEASAMTEQIAPAYDLVWSALDAAEREKIDRGLIAPLLKNLDKHKAGKSNWQTWHNAAMVWGGAVLGDVAWLRRAITQPKHGFLAQMQVSVTAEGMWYENSWGYHIYTLRALTRIAAGCKRVGVDLWGHPRLAAMYSLPVHYTMADGSLPRFGDDVNSSVLGARDLLEHAHAVYGDDAILALLPTSPTFTSVQLGRDLAATVPPLGLHSRVFPGAGHAILRNETGMTAALTFGPFGGFHGHFDKLSFVFFAAGKELAVDPGRARSQAYRLPIHRDWYRATLSHNTVVVDGKSQDGVGGVLRRFGATPQVAAVAALVDRAYPGVRHERLMVLMPGYLLVADLLTSRRPHRYDWVYHARANTVQCAVANGDADWETAYQGREYVRSAKSGGTDAAVPIRFAHRQLGQHLLVAGRADTTVTVGDGPVATVHERSPLAMVTRRGRRADFAVVVEPVAAGAKPVVTRAEAKFGKDAWVIDIGRGDKLDSVVYRPGKSVQVFVEGRRVLASSDGE